MYSMGEKPRYLYFLNNFCQIAFYFDNFWHKDTWMKLQQNSDKIIHLS